MTDDATSCARETTSLALFEIGNSQTTTNTLPDPLERRQVLKSSPISPDSRIVPSLSALCHEDSTRRVHHSQKRVTTEERSLTRILSFDGWIRRIDYKSARDADISPGHDIDKEQSLNFFRYHTCYVSALCLLGRLLNPRRSTSKYEVGSIC